MVVVIGSILWILAQHKKQINTKADKGRQSCCTHRCSVGLPEALKKRVLALNRFLVGARMDKPMVSHETGPSLDRRRARWHVTQISKAGT